MSFVLDCSVALTWCFEEERTPATKALLIHVGESGAVAPLLWPAEALNGLNMAERRKRLDATHKHQLIEFLHHLPITLDAEMTLHIWKTTQRLAERFRLTIYDAIYLELAIRRNLPLATLDKDLRRAATSLGIKLLGHKNDAVLFS